MRRFTIYSAFAAALLTGFTACSDSDDVTGGQTAGDGATSYISINIVNPEATPAGAKANGFTRADGYVNGSSTEGHISNVRFYFFGDNGNPYLLSNSTPANVNWLDVNIANNTELQNDPTTVERVTNAVLLINGASGTMPSYIVAVANPGALTNANASSPTTDLLGQSALNEQQLFDGAMQTTTYRVGSDGDFLMTNSVYGEGSSEQNAARTNNNIYDNRDSALAHPVQVYVERLASKVTITHSASNRWQDNQNVGTAAEPQNRSIFNLGYTKYFDGNKEDSVELYATIQGVGLADEQRYGKLFKDITGYQTWGSLLGIQPNWYSTDYHRSFWEVTPAFNTANDDNPIDRPFTSYTTGFYNSETGANVFYTMPNTPTPENRQSAEDANRNSDRTYRTKVLLAAQLKYRDASGNWQNAEICNYRGENYLGQESLKAIIASQLSGQLCKKQADGTFRNIQASDIGFAAPPAGNADYKSYEVIPNLSDQTGEFALGSADAANAAVQASQAVTTYRPNPSVTPVTGDALDDVFYRYASKASIYKDGDTYYYTSIRHLAENENSLGYFGVVRNHWYQVNINLLGGLGTPVYNPDQPIVPVTPSDKNSYLAAQINVLQWRVVPQTVDIDGTAKH